MYAKNHNYVTFFTRNTANTDKVTYGRVNEATKTGQKSEDGKNVYKFESWNALFVGKAREKALTLEDKTPITLTEWAVHPGYNKEKKQSYPYLMVMDFEVREKSSKDDDATQAPAQVEGEEFAPLDEEGLEGLDLPF